MHILHCAQLALSLEKCAPFCAPPFAPERHGAGRLVAERLRTPRAEVLRYVAVSGLLRDGPGRSGWEGKWALWPFQGQNTGSNPVGDATLCGTARSRGRFRESHKPSTHGFGPDKLTGSTCCAAY